MGRRLVIDAMLDNKGRQLFWLLPFLLLLLGCEAGLPTERTEYVAGGNAERGRQVFAEYGCGSCHLIPNVPGAHSTVAPPLTYWADRVYIAGNLPNRPDNLVRWLMDPQAIEPGTAMPNLFVTEQDARDMSAYLYSLR